MRPVLAPAARRTWRGRRTLQLTLGPDRAVLLEGLDDRLRLLLPLLDGVRTRDQVERAAQASGCPEPAAVLDALHSAGLLVDADDLQVPLADRADRHRLGPDLAALTLLHGTGAARALRARQGARVVVHGAGRVGAALAALLSEAAVGTVDVRDRTLTRWEDVAVGGLRPEDVGRARSDALTERLASAGSAARPALVVLTEDVPEDLLRVLVRDEIPHLRASVEGTVGTVGPLVLPGRSACLTCVTMVRTAIDPDWPALAAQAEPAPLLEASHGLLASAVAAQAALQAVELLEGGTPGSVGGTLELELPGWQWRRRTWPGHPGCTCGAAERPADGAPGVRLVA